MDNILQVEAIVKNIVGDLNVKDYVNFKCISKRVYSSWLNKETDYIYFSNKLKQIGLDEETIVEPSENKLIDDVSYNDISVLNSFEKIKTFNKQNYLTIYKVLYQTFNDYCENLYSNKLANFFPVQYEKDPLQQSQILQNISRFNVSNNNDFEYYTKVVTNFKILKEIFINSCLNEMEINYNEAEYTAVGKFTKVLLTFGEQNMVIDFFNSKIEYPSVPTLPESDEDTTSTTDNKSNIFSDEELVKTLKPLNEFVNKNISVIDLLFEENYSMFTNFFESFIQQSLIPFVNKILKDDRNEDTFINGFPSIYSHVIEEFCTNLDFSINGSINEEKLDKEQRDKLFHKRVYDLLNVYLQPNILKYLDQSSIQFEKNILKQFTNFQIEQKEKSENEMLNLTAENSTIDINENQNKDGDKYNFLDSFTKVFGITSKNSKAEQMNDNLTSLMNNSLRNIKNLINLELCLSIVRQTQARIDIFLQFKTSMNLSTLINEKCENIFRILIKCLNENHIQPAYEKAILLLQSYDINDLPINVSNESSDSKDVTQSVEPLVNFAELINTSDIILQMISIFYRNEMVTKKIIDPTEEAKKNVWQSGLLQTKKNFESAVDSFVADGLNIGINKLVDQINHTFKTVQLPTDYYPPAHKNTVEIKPTECCRKTITLLDNHCFLLNGATDKGTIDVYQQEIGKRFFNILVEHLKTQIISTEGAIILICDMNLYFDFFNQKLKQKSIIPYFQALKNVSNLFLIDGKDSKELGKLIGDLNKFQGIFSQEEIYEFVQRRQDWLSVKRDVEKVMYGLGLKDCVIM